MVGIVYVALMFLGAASAFAVDGTTKAACLDAQSIPDQRIIGCTLLIDETRGTALEKYSAYLGRARAYVVQQDWDRAIADFNLAISLLLNPQYSIPYNGRGLAYSKKGDQRKAIADFTEAISLNGSYANAYNNRGIAQVELGNFDQAIADLKMSVRLSESNANFYNELAWAHFRARRASAGLPYADHALRLNPNHANAYDTRGSIYEALGENAKAVADFEKALSLDPSLLKSAEALSRIARGDPALSSFADIVRLVQERGWQANLGVICAELGLAEISDNCVFNQVSVQASENGEGPRGINVPVISNSEISYVLIFHLRPLVGEFFIVSPQGSLIKAFVRRKGAGYSKIANEEVDEEFKADLAYWTANLDRLTQDLKGKRIRRE